MKNYKIYDLFLNCGVLNDFPFPIDDFDSLTQYEMLIKCINHIKKLYENDATLTNRINALANYIENLDLQDEVNNKIDEMLESGQLQEIITEYLQINGVLAFNTVSDMVSATNIIDGSICRTLGLNTYNDGKGEFYKIRTITSEDTVDGVNIIALNVSNTLIAEKIPNYYINDLQSQITSIDSNRTILVGDSYALNRTELSISGWQVPLQSLLNLSDNDCLKLANSGAGFKRSGDMGTFLQHLQGSANQITNHNTVKNIIVCGGLNDRIYTVSEIEEKIEEFITYCNTEYPNATVYIGHIGNNKGYEESQQLERLYCLVRSLPAYQNCTKYGGVYLNGVELIMKDYSNYYDNSHPNNTASLNLAKGIYNALKSGYCTVSYTRENNIPITNGIVSGATLPISYDFFNGTLSLEVLNQYSQQINFTSNQTSDGLLDLGEVDIKYYRNIFPFYFATSIESTLILSDDSSVNVSSQLFVNAGHMYYRFSNPTGTTYTIKSIRLRTMSFTLNGIYC